VELERLARAERQTRKQLQDIPAEEQRRISDARQRAASRMQEVARLRTANSDNEAHELRQLGWDVAQAVGDLERRIAALNTAEADERDGILKRRQGLHLQQRLQAASLSFVKLYGIGPKLRDRLMGAGFRTAADINHRVFRVKDIKDQRGETLLAWRRSVEQEARATEPKALPPQEVAAIRARYQPQQEALHAQRAQELERSKDAQQAIREKYRQEAENLDRREAAIQGDRQQEESDIRDQQAKRRAQLEGHLARLAQEQKTSQALSDLGRKISEGRPRLAKLSWDKARASKHVGAMAARSTFYAYVRRIFYFR
jgi:DNA-binding helix-hairpin-helix protein with protein kinase domain